VATQDDVRRIALSFPATTEGTDGFAFSVDGKAFVWAWQERIDPKRARVPSRDVIAVRVGNEFEKESMIEMDPAVFFTEAHYDGYPAILVRLGAIDLDLLEVALSDGWRCRASKRLLAAYPGRRPGGPLDQTDPLPPTIGGPAMRALTAAGVADVGQLTAFSEAEVGALHGVGPRVVAELRSALSARGLSFRTRSDRSPAGSRRLR
jgi:hypothetical protein